MFGLDPDIGNSAVRLWIAAGSAALLVFICVLAFDWTRTRTLARVSAIVIGAVLGGTLAWSFLNMAGERDRSTERRALETRVAALNVQVLAPGSPLPCLDALSGDSVEVACEKALFATPATVAMAESYVAARLALLADMNAYARHGGGDIDDILLPLRRGLETDRFGFVAHMLQVRDGCTSNRCPALSLLHDPSRVRGNLVNGTLDHYLDRYVALWAQAPGPTVADTGAAPTAVAAQTGEPAPPRKSVLNIEFPSADSIPAVSIMNPEPKGPVTPASATAAVEAGQQSSAKVVGPQRMPPMPGTPAATASRERETPAKGKRRQAANPPPARTAAQAPPPAAPPVDPVWSPGATLASPQPAAGAAASASVAGAAAAGAPAASAPAASSGPAGVPLAGMPVQLAPYTSAPPH
ncbi:MAG TPA: hypothetical protein VMA30_12955 [Xanthobacteraceae bacterium]|nr:hypothetical protein [Xanthobacteraceae bacterium]